MTKNQILKVIAKHGRLVTQIRVKGSSTKGLGDCVAAKNLEKSGQIKLKTSQTFEEDGWKIEEFIWEKNE